MALVTIEEVRSHLNLTSAAQDAEAQMFADAASDLVTESVGIKLGVGPVIERVTSSSGRLLLSAYPVVSVEQIGAVSAPEGVFSESFVDVYEGYVATEPIINAEAGIIWSPYSNGVEAEVRYTAGIAPPAAVKVATLAVVARLWETQRGNAPTAVPTQDGFAPDTGALPLLPPLARTLLEPYRRGPGIA